METMNNITSSATRAIWGDSSTNNNQSTESGTEPVSGKTGNTSSGEPYDAGNSDSTNTERTTATGNTDTAHTSNTGNMGNIDNMGNTGNISNTDNMGNTDNTDHQSTTGGQSTTGVRSMLAGNTDTTDTSRSGAPSSGPNQTDAPGNTASTGPIRPEHETDKTGVTSANQPSTAFGSDKPSNSNDNSGPGPAPSVGADPASGQQNTQKHQGADRPHEEPSSDEHSRIQEAKDEAEKAQQVDTSGPGPKPLSETHKAGGAGASSKSGGDGDDDGPQKESHGEGTGEKYVKSSGMKADGGDFDAANPGAGKEADRLLETKGVHREAGPGADSGSDKKVDPLEEKLNKPSLGDKIKNKLHMN